MSITSNIFVVLLSFSMFVFASTAQTTLTLQPGPNDGKDAFVHGLNSEINVNYGMDNQFCATSWTFGGEPGTVRALLEFDLSTIPPGAIITSAELSLYGIGDNSSLGGHSKLSGSNEGWLQRITSVWDENTVTWNTQPSVTSMNQVGLAQSVGVDDDYLDMNVTDLVQDMVNNGNFGFLLKLQNENYYRRLNFGSSDNVDGAIRPKLIVTYSSDPCLTLRPNAIDGKDAFVHGLNSEMNVNYGMDNQFCTTAWTFGGEPGTVRALLEFDLSTIPSGAVITSAELSLYGIGDNSSLGGHSTLSGSNEAWIQRVTSAWNENTVTWNTQPSVNSMNQVALAQSIGTDDDYLDIDVASLVQDMVDNGNYGFMLRLQNENYYRRLNFGSSDHVNPLFHPQLIVCYDNSSATLETLTELTDVTLYPNPVEDEFFLLVDPEKQGVLSLNILSSDGRVVFSSDFDSNNQGVNVSKIPEGIYFVQILENNTVIALKKFIKASF